MYILLKVESLSMNSSWSDKSFENPPPDTTSISMAVIPADRDHIELATGEVFRHPRKHFGDDDKPKISASVYVSTQLDPTRKSRMSYFEPHRSTYGDLDSDASISFDFALEGPAFHELISNIRGGLFPASLLVEFDHTLGDDGGPLSYLDDFDGSGVKWDNKGRERSVIPIKAIRFNYQILQPAPMPDSAEAADAAERPIPWQPPSAVSDENSKALLAAVGDINANLKRLTKVLIVIVAAALGVSYKFW